MEGAEKNLSFGPFPKADRYSVEIAAKVSNGRSSRYTLANLLDTAVPITSRRRKKAPEARLPALQPGLGFRV